MFQTPTQTQQPTFNQGMPQQTMSGFYQPQIYPPQQYQPRQIFTPPVQQSQQTASQLQANPIAGRYISNLSEIAPNEVPMDKNFYFFPMSDGSCVYVKGWTSDGVLQTFKYVPEISNESDSEPQQDFNSVVLARLDKIEELVKNKYHHNKYQKRDYSNKNDQQNKESDSDAVS